MHVLVMTVPKTNTDRQRQWRNLCGEFIGKWSLIKEFLIYKSQATKECNLWRYQEHEKGFEKNINSTEVTKEREGEHH